MDNSLAVSTSQLPDAHSNQTPDDNNDISRAELEAIAEGVLSPQEFALWTILHDPAQVDGRSRLSALCQRAGYSDIGQHASRIVSGVFGKMEAAGVARARSLDVMCGFTASRVKQGLAELFEVEDKRLRLKAYDVASKVMGLQGGQAPQVTVNVGVQVLGGRVGQLLRDALDDESPIVDADK